MSNQKFEGAVTGKEGSYKDRTLLLENRCEVFFHIEGEQIYVDQSPEGAKQEFGILNSVKNMQCSRRRQAQYI